MHTSAPDPWNVNDHRWEPPDVSRNVTIETEHHRASDQITVYEPDPVGTPESWIETAVWYPRADWQ